MSDTNERKKMNHMASSSVARGRGMEVFLLISYHPSPVLLPSKEKEKKKGKNGRALDLCLKVLTIR